MSRVYCLEPVGGIAGDMFLATALDLGLPLADLEAELRKLPLTGWRFEVAKAERHAITGTHVDVVIDAPAAHEHRAWKGIREMLQASALQPAIRERALSIFERIAVAEAKVHGISVEEVHFHEVGAVDSIVDVVGAAVVVQLLGEPDLYCSPPPLGSGFVKAAHGNLPVPPPATLEILKDRPVKFEGVGELTTPTGAGIVAALTRAERFPEVVVERVGYGVGTKDFRDRPNVLRGLLGRTAHGAEAGTWLLEANLDDATPQLLAYALEGLLAAGALDVWIAPVTMKKGRPGHVLSVLAAGTLRAELTERMLRETSSLGVRARAVERTALERRFEKVQTPFGEVSVKIGELNGRRLNATPEYEDCARLARERDVPLKEVLAAALAALAGR